MSSAAKKASTVTIKTRKFISNRLLHRKQFLLDVLHPGRQVPSLSDLKTKVAKQFSVKDLSRVFLFGFRTDFGGNKSSGFGLIYDTAEDAKKVEPRFRLVRNKLAKKTEGGRKQIKERKNRAKIVRGKERAKVRKAAAKKK